MAKPVHSVEARAVREYVELEASGESVIHLEKVASERVFGTKHSVWDVHTDKGRWWVLTDPTNLYSQRDFPSLDYILTFHVGLIARTMSQTKRESPASFEEKDRFAAAWRRWEQAGAALETCEEAEDFQAVGMRCREALIELVRGATRPDMVPEGQETPKRGDFVHWAELFAQTVASGSSGEELRHYMKATSKSTWQLVNWLTHASNATRRDAEIAVDGTAHALGILGEAAVRHDRKAPDRCPKCRSYQITSEYRADLERDPPYRTVCLKCGWSDVPIE